MSIVGKSTPGSKLLTPADHALVLIDFQSQMAFATKSIDMAVLRTNAGLVARTHGGAYGLGVTHAKTMFGAHEG